MISRVESAPDDARDEIFREKSWSAPTSAHNFGGEKHVALARAERDWNVRRLALIFGTATAQLLSEVLELDLRRVGCALRVELVAQSVVGESHR